MMMFSCCLIVLGEIYNNRKRNEFQLNNLDDGWSSGNMELKDNASTTVSLTRNGENTFKVF